MLLHTLTGDPQWENIYFIQKHIPGVQIGSYSPSAPVIPSGFKNMHIWSSKSSLIYHPREGAVVYSSQGMLRGKFAFPALQGKAKGTQRHGQDATGCRGKYSFCLQEERLQEASRGQRNPPRSPGCW